MTPLLLTALLLLPQEPKPERFPDQPQQDALQYDLALHVDPAQRQLTGTVHYRFRADAPLRSIRLDARRSDAWQVTFADAAGAELPAAWDDEAQCVVLKLPKELAKGDEVGFTAALAGTPVDGFYFKPNRYGDALAFTDHYSIRARGWLPCEDNPTDRARFRLHVEYPRDCEAVGFGVPVEPDPHAPAPPSGFTALDLVGDTEIPPYMWALVVGPFARVHEDGDPRLLDHFVYKQDVAAARRALVHEAAWLHTMEQTFGPYAFGKYTTVQCPTRWGGFEAPGNVQLAENLFDSPDGVSTLAHELVHMWFGDGVGYARWREVWLSEGFASYFGPWLWSQQGGPPLADAMRDLRVRWLRSRDGRTKSVRDDSFAHPDQALNDNTYPKGAWVLHMLRGEIGESMFYSALAQYYRKNVGRSLVTADFVAAVQETSGQDLGWFFAQWLDRVGCPELKVAAQDGAITVTQTQKGEPYRFWLRLRWHGADGAVIERRQRIDQQEQRLAVDGAVQGLEVDPAVELLFRPAR